MYMHVSLIFKEHRTEVEISIVLLKQYSSIDIIATITNADSIRNHCKNYNRGFN